MTHHPTRFSPFPEMAPLPTDMEVSQYLARHGICFSTWDKPTLEHGFIYLHLPEDCVIENHSSVFSPHEHWTIIRQTNEEEDTMHEKIIAWCCTNAKPGYPDLSGSRCVYSNPYRSRWAHENYVGEDEFEPIDYEETPVVWTWETKFQTENPDVITMTDAKLLDIWRKK